MFMELVFEKATELQIAVTKSRMLDRTPFLREVDKEEVEKKENGGEDHCKYTRKANVLLDQIRYMQGSWEDEFEVTERYLDDNAMGYCPNQTRYGVIEMELNRAQRNLQNYIHNEPFVPLYHRRHLQRQERQQQQRPQYISTFSDNGSYNDQRKRDLIHSLDEDDTDPSDVPDPTSSGETTTTTSSTESVTTTDQSSLSLTSSIATTITPTITTTATTDPSSSQSLVTTVDSTGTTIDPTTAVSTAIESTATTIAVTATTTAATTAIDTTTIEPTTAITATDSATVSTITATPSASIQTSPSPQQTSSSPQQTSSPPPQTSSSPQQTSNPGKTTTKQPPTTSFASGDGQTKVPATTTSPSADGSISKPPGSESSSSSNKTAITIGVVIGAVVVAAGIGVWVFRKAKLSPSREFKSKMRNSDLGSSGVLPGSVDARDPDNYEGIFRPPNHDTERPMTATSMGTTGLAGAAIGASGLTAARPSTSVSGSSPDAQNADYYYQNYPQGQYDQQPGYDQYQQDQYDQYPQSYDQQQQHGYDQYQQGYDQYQQPLPPQQHTVPDYAQYRYAQGGPATVGGANGSSGVYESGAHDGVLGGDNNNLSNDYARFLRELRE
ncbi:hypothetical protein BGZ46_005192 [Entomortierella lignicola]|nr:hypothetical protein BGZ46_005192 [Entomortierella lignicola]